MSTDEVSRRLTCLSCSKEQLRGGGLCLAWVHVERCDGASLTWSRIALEVDFSEVLLVLLDVVVERKEETLGVLWAHNNA